MQPQNPNPMQQGPMPPSMPSQPMGYPPQQFTPPPAPQMLAPEPWQPQPQPAPAPQFQQTVAYQQTPLPMNQMPQAAMAYQPPAAPPASAQPQFTPPPAMPMPQPAQQFVSQPAPASPMQNNFTAQPQPAPQFQQQPPVQPRVEQAQPPVVQQFEMQIPHDDRPAPQPQMAPAADPAIPSPQPWQPAQPASAMPQTSYQPPAIQQMPIEQAPPQPQPASPITPWQPQSEEPGPASVAPAPSPVAPMPMPPATEQPAPAEPAAVSSDSDDEMPHHHELNIEPPESLKSANAQPQQPNTSPINPGQWFQSANTPPLTSGVQPVQTQVSQPLFPSDTPLQSFSQQQEARNRRHGLMLIAILVIALLVLGGGALIYTVLNTRKTNDPQAVFNSMLSKSLATKQVHQSIVEGKTGTQVQVDYDVSDVAKPRILASTQIGGEANTKIMKYYSTFQDTFVQYQNTAGGTEAYLNKWIQVRNKGVLQPNGEITLAPSFEARRLFFGQMVFGNFASSDRKSLESAFKGGVFTYDKTKVKTETLGGGKTFVYEVKINTDMLVAYNQKIAKVVGVNASDVNKESLQSVTSAMLYVDAATQRLLRVVTGDATINYTKYNSVAIQSQPASQMSWSDFLAANGLAASSGSSAATTSESTTSSGATNADTSGSSDTGTSQTSAGSDASFDDPNFDDPLWNGDAGEQ